ncbi:hypothetical protein RND81_08G036900 [Saponaria officinalis]|uniref:Uncharacterized protein n=1 Tax=Saponaria officinalis TaxID=3572 RepID=A0AAW1J370_SAPOF
MGVFFTIKVQGCVFKGIQICLRNGIEHLRNVCTWIMDLFVLDIEQSHFLLYCCQWLVPALILHGDSSGLQLLVEVTPKSLDFSGSFRGFFGEILDEIEVGVSNLERGGRRRSTMEKSGG